MGRKVIHTILNLRDNMSGGLVKAAKNVKGVNREMLAATRTVERFQRKTADACSRAVRSLGKLGLAAGGAAAALGIKSGLSEAMDLEGYRLQLETATKDTVKAAGIMKYAVDLANRTPFEGGELVEGAAKFEAMGMSAEQWLTRAGDMAAATNKSFDQATEALIDAQTGELERLKEFGITKAMIVAQGEKLFRKVQLVNNKGQIVNQEKFNQALISLMEDKFAGGMEKQAGTMKGLWSTVTGVTKSALAEMVGMSNDGSIRAGSAMERLKGGVSQLAGRLEQWQQDGTLARLGEQLDQGLARGLDLASRGFQWLAENGDRLIATLKPLAVTVAAVKVGKLGLDALNAANNFIQYTKTVGLTTAANLRSAGAWTKNTVAMMANKAGMIAATAASRTMAAATGLAAAAQKGLNAAYIASPMGMVVLGIMGVVAAGALLIGSWDEVKACAADLWQRTTELFGGIGDSIILAFDSAKTAVSGFFSWIGEGLAWLNGAIESVPVIGSIYKGAKSIGGAVLGALSGHALGTPYFSGGLTRINERGGEIVDLPSGTRIIPHDVSRRMAGGTSITIYLTVQGSVIGNAEFADQLGRIIAQRVLRAAANC